MNRAQNAKALTVLGDPTRRAIFERLATGPLPVGKLAEKLPVSRSAVSQHLAALRTAGLVTQSIDGTRRVYAIDPDGLGVLREWIDRLWEANLERFRAEADREAKK